jgi:hypothetical protein
MIEKRFSGCAHDASKRDVNGDSTITDCLSFGDGRYI